MLTIANIPDTRLRTNIKYSGLDYFPEYLGVSALESVLEIQSHCKKYKLSIDGIVSKIQNRMVIDFQLKPLIEQNEKFKMSQGIVTIITKEDITQRISTNIFNIYIGNAIPNLPTTLF